MHGQMNEYQIGCIRISFKQGKVFSFKLNKDGDRVYREIKSLLLNRRCVADNTVFAFKIWVNYGMCDLKEYFNSSQVYGSNEDGYNCSIVDIYQLNDILIENGFFPVKMPIKKGGMTEMVF